MKAVILAGGKGTRLGKLTENIPKPMVLLAGKPILQYQVELCARYGLEEIILIVNHLSKPIEEHFGDGANFGIPVRYFHEKEPLGTVGGVKELENELTTDFLVLYGDVMMEMDLQKLIDFHQKKASEATLVVHPNDHPYDSDLIETNEKEQIISVWPKPHAENFRYHNLVNAAVYLFSPRIFSFLQKGVKADFGKDIFPRMHQQLKMYSYNTPEYLKDMGTPERKTQVEQDIQSGKVQRRSLAHRQKAIFLDRDGVINEDSGLIHRPEDFKLYPFATEAIRTINTSDYLTVLATNQSVVARNLTTIEGLDEIHKKMETELGNAGAKLDHIRYCPHHPDKGYPEENPAYKIKCHCRKPKPGMLTDAAEKLNIDLRESWMIGDSQRDIEAGKAAGCRTVGLMTGQGLQNTEVLPDYFFPDLREAVNFILSDAHKAPIQEVLEKTGQAETQPYVLNIGGNSRSGKSTFATTLQQKLESAGYSVFRINLDDWIRPREERQEKDEVLYNFQIDKLESDVHAILQGKKVTLHPYRTHEKRPEKAHTYLYQKEPVILIEGVVALATDELRDLASFNIFMKIDENTYRERFHTFYRWKGYPEAQIEKLLKHRLKNEYRPIAENERFADKIIG